MGPAYYCIQHIIVCIVYNVKQHTMSTHAFNIYLLNFHLYTYYCYTMLHSALHFILLYIRNICLVFILF